MRLAAATAAIVVVASTTTAAQEYTVRMQGANGPMTIYVSRNAVRRTEPGFSVDVIYRLSEGKIIYIDHQKKTYSEVSLAEARQHGAKAAADMTPQQKAMMSRMGMNAAPTFTKVGPGETIAGYATEKYVMKTPAMEAEISAAPALSLPSGYYEATRASAGAFGAATQSGAAMTQHQRHDSEAGGTNGDERDDDDRGRDVGGQDPDSAVDIRSARGVQEGAEGVLTRPI